MAVNEQIKDVKVVLDLTKGSQTISNCKVDATAEELYDIGHAIGSLHAEDIQRVYKVTQTELI